MSVAFSRRLAAAFAPPEALALPFSGIDVSTSGVKAVRLSARPAGLILESHMEVPFQAGTFSDGEIVDQEAARAAIREAAHRAGVVRTNAALPDSKAYLFETTVPGTSRDEWRVGVEQHLDELVPLPPAETVFDVAPTAPEADGMRVAGVGFARRVIENTISTFDAAGVDVCALEGETFAMARALLPTGDTSTTLIVDVGKTTTKLVVVEGRIPRFASTINIGGHALTLAVQKYFGVTEAEARRVKAERGIVPAAGNEEYLASMLSTVSAIRDEIGKHLDYWQSRVSHTNAHQPVSQAILAGGNASVRGLPEYLEGSLRVPVSTGDVFTNLASRDTWLPDIDYAASLAYGTAIGLALRDASGEYDA